MTVHSPPRRCLPRCSSTRRIIPASIPRRHLAGYCGILQADAYAGFNALYAPDRKPGPITEAGCWARARRKLLELADITSKGRNPKQAAIAPIAFEAVRGSHRGPLGTNATGRSAHYLVDTPKRRLSRFCTPERGGSIMHKMLTQKPPSAAILLSISRPKHFRRRKPLPSNTRLYQAAQPAKRCSPCKL